VVVLVPWWASASGVVGVGFGTRCAQEEADVCWLHFQHATPNQLPLRDCTAPDQPCPFFLHSQSRSTFIHHAEIHTRRPPRCYSYSRRSSACSKLAHARTASSTNLPDPSNHHRVFVAKLCYERKAQGRKGNHIVGAQQTQSYRKTRGKTQESRRKAKVTQEGPHRETEGCRGQEERAR